MSLALRILGGVLLAVLLILLAALVILLFIKVRIFLDLTPGGFAVRVKAGPVGISVYPPKGKKVKKKKEQEKKKEKPPEEKLSPTELIAQFWKISEQIKRALGKLADALVIEHLHISVIAAGSDPAQAAILYGGIAAAVGMLIPLFEANFHIRERSIRVLLDFEETAPKTDLHAVFAIRILSAVIPAAAVGLAFIKQMRKNKKEKAVSQ